MQEDVDLIFDLYRECKFESELGLSVALSWLFCCLLSNSLKTKPMHIATAPEMGSGKSSILDIGIILATGERPSAIPLPPSEEEMVKVLLTQLRKGCQFLCFDNTPEHMESNALSIVLTQPTIEGRLLGTNESLSATCDILIGATGNNLKVKGDLVVRTLACKLLSKNEKGIDIQWERDITAYCLENRTRLVGAALNILYSAAKEQRASQKPLSRFEDWSRCVQKTITALQLPDPANSLRISMEEDPIQETCSAIWELWHEATLGMVTTLQGATRQSTDLHEYMVERFPGRDGGYNPRTAGNWLNKYQGRVQGNILFERTGSFRHAVTYKTSVV
jgi:hypothetical protein